MIPVRNVDISHSKCDPLDINLIFLNPMWFSSHLANTWTAGISPVSCSKSSRSEKSSLSSYLARPQNKDLRIWTFKHPELSREVKFAKKHAEYECFEDWRHFALVLLRIIFLLRKVCFMHGRGNLLRWEWNWWIFGKFQNSFQFNHKSFVRELVAWVPARKTWQNSFENRNV